MQGLKTKCEWLSLLLSLVAALLTSQAFAGEIVMQEDFESAGYTIGSQVDVGSPLLWTLGGITYPPGFTVPDGSTLDPLLGGPVNGRWARICAPRMTSTGGTKAAEFVDVFTTNVPPNEASWGIKAGMTSPALQNYNSGNGVQKGYVQWDWYAFSPINHHVMFMIYDEYPVTEAGAADYAKALTRLNFNQGGGGFNYLMFEGGGPTRSITQQGGNKWEVTTAYRTRVTFDLTVDPKVVSCQMWSGAPDFTTVNFDSNDPSTLMVGETDLGPIAIMGDATFKGVRGFMPYCLEVTNRNPSFEVDNVIVWSDISGPSPEVTVDAANVADGETTPVDLGSYNLAKPADEKVFTVANAGTQPLTVSGITVPTGVIIVKDLTAGDIAPGASDTFTIEVDTTAEVTISGDIAFTTNLPGAETFNFAVSGAVYIAPEVEIWEDATEINNGGGPISFDAGQTRIFTAKNTGHLDLEPAGLSVPSGYTIVEPLSNTIAPGTQDTFSVQLTATTAGTHAGNVSFTSNDFGNPTFSFSVTGTISPEVEVWDGVVQIFNGGGPISFDAGQIRFFTIKNAGPIDLTISNLTIPAGYAIAEALNPTIAPGSEDSFSIELTATSAGTYEGNIGFNTNDLDEPNFAFSVSATISPELEVWHEGSEISSGSGPIQFDVAQTKVFTVKNTGPIELTISNLTIPAGYAIAEPLNATIAPGSEDSFSLELTATSPGTYEGNVAFNTNDLDEPDFNFAVTALLAPELAVYVDEIEILDGAVVDLKKTTDGSVLQKTLTIKNLGNIPLTISEFASPENFVFNEPLPGEIPAGSEIARTIILTATEIEVYHGSAALSTNDDDEPIVTLNLLGTVSLPSHSFYTGVNGQAGTYSLSHNEVIAVLRKNSTDRLIGGLLRCMRGNTYSADDLFAGFESPFYGPVGLTRTASAHYVVADASAYTLHIVDPRGNIKSTISLSDQPQANPAEASVTFDGPNVDPGDILYSLKSGAIMAVNPVTQTITTFVESGTFPTGGFDALEMGSDGYLYAVWFGSGIPIIYRFSANGTSEIFYEFPYYFDTAPPKIEFDRIRQCLYFTHTTPLAATDPRRYVYRKNLQGSDVEFVADLGMWIGFIQMSADGRSLLAGSGDPNFLNEIELEPLGLPTLDQVILSPTSPRKIDTIVATPVNGNAAGNPPISYQCQWRKNGTLVPGANGLTISGGLFKRGDVVSVAVTPSTSAATGYQAETVGLVIGNSPPPAPVVRVLPENPVLGDDLAVDVLTYSVDPDGDPVDYSFKWFKSTDYDYLHPENATWIHKAELNNTSQVSGVYLFEGDVWRFELTPFETGVAPAFDLAKMAQDLLSASPINAEEELLTGEPGFAQVYIGANRSPAVSIQSPPPSGVACDQSYTIQWNSSDPDGHNRVVDLYYDADGIEGGSTPIALLQPASGSVVWNTSAIVPGDYFVFARVTDSKGAIGEAFSVGKIKVYHGVLSNVESDIWSQFE